MKLAGKVAVVTGAARGIGLACATCMAEAGAAVVISDVRRDALETAKDRLVGRSLTVTAFPGDVTALRDNAALVAHAIETFGSVDIFHANAGFAPFEDLLDASPESISRALEVNLTGAMLGCAAVLPGMIARMPGPRIGAR